jgi:hypothetical protein
MISEPPRCFFLHVAASRSNCPAIGRSNCATHVLSLVVINRGAGMDGKTISHSPPRPSSSSPLLLPRALLCPSLLHRKSDASRQCSPAASHLPPLFTFSSMLPPARISGSTLPGRVNFSGSFSKVYAADAINSGEFFLLCSVSCYSTPLGFSISLVLIWLDLVDPI